MSTAYYRDVAFALRNRGVPEADVASTLDDLLERARTRPPGSERESPEVIASGFDARRSRGLSRSLGIAGGLLMVIAVGIQLLGFFVFATDLRAGPFPFFAVSVVVFLALVGLAAGIDHRLPRGFRPRA